MAPRPPTPKQVLAEHVAKHHRRLPAGAGRWTRERLARWHVDEHHRFNDSLDHYHAGPNRGPGERPPGWHTGADAVPREDHP